MLCRFENLVRSFTVPIASDKYGFIEHSISSIYICYFEIVIYTRNLNSRKRK